MPIQWVDLEKRVTKDMLDEKQQAILEELLQADMEQNPVLIKYYFKWKIYFVECPHSVVGLGHTILWDVFT